MNLITTQQRTTRLHKSTEDHIWASEPVVVHTNYLRHAPDRRGNIVPVPIDPTRDAGELWTDRYGIVLGSDSKMHRQNKSRACVHAIKVPMPTELFGVGWVRQLGWQPTLYSLGACPVIASRIEDLVTLAFDVVGPVEGCRLKPGPLQEANRWTYRMRPIVFDDKPGEVYSSAWLGIWPD
jgi:hypothetical protein